MEGTALTSQASGDRAAAAAAVMQAYCERPYKLGEADCATLCRDYVELLTGKRHEWDDDVFTVKAVKKVLGKPKRGFGEYGDIVLYESHLSVNLGYCMLTMVEGFGMARASAMEGGRAIHWSPEQWARAS